ncbi:MAG: hypothetical protein O7C98_03390 [Planctomycetota bacterium]|nr:hypothetical protein [Planctomycetota bacterium]
MRYLFWLLLALGLGAGAQSAWAQDGCGCSEMEEGSVSEEEAAAEEKRTRTRSTAPRAGEAPKGGRKAAPARTPGARVKKVWQQDKAKLFSFRVPEDWVVIPFDGNRAFAAEVLLPGVTRRSTLSLEHHTEMPSPRVWPVRRREGTKDRYSASRIEVGMRPLPFSYAAYTTPDGDDRRLAEIFGKLMGHGFVLTLDCPEAAWDEARKDLMDAALSIRADLEPAPPPARKFKAKKKRRYLFLTHPSVKGSTAYMSTLILGQQKKFSKLHGKPSASDVPNQVYVLRDREDARPILERAADHSMDYFTDHVHGRMFVKYVAKGNEEGAGWLAGETQGLLFGIVYGTLEPRWVLYGEQAAARAEQLTGKKLPFLTAGMAAWREGLNLGPLDRLPEIQKSNWDSYARQSFFYVCFFHAGPSKYRKAYKQFLKEWRETGDGERAAEKHLRTLGLKKIQQAATKWVYQDLKALSPKPR